MKVAISAFMHQTRRTVYSENFFLNILHHAGLYFPLFMGCSGDGSRFLAAGQNKWNLLLADRCSGPHLGKFYYLKVS